MDRDDDTRSDAAPATPPACRPSGVVSVPAMQPSVSTLLVAGAVVTVASVAWFVLRLVHPFGSTVLGWLPLPLSTLLGLVAAWSAAREPGLAPPARRFWRCLAIAAIFVTLALVSSAYDALAGAAPVQHVGPLSVALFSMSVVFVTGGLLRKPVRGRAIREWLTAGLDIAIMAVAVGLLLSYFILERPSNRYLFGSNAMVFTAIAVLATMVITVSMRASLAGNHGVDRRSIGVLAGVAALSALLVVNSSMLAHRPDLSILMPAIPTTYLGVVVAAVLQRRAASELQVRGHRRRRAFNVMPYATIACTDALLLIAVRDSRGGIQMMVAGSVAMTALVVIRQLFAFADNSRLLAKVDASMLELRRHERRFRSLVQNSDDVISIIDAAGRFVYVSPGSRRVMGFEPEDWIGKRAQETVHADDLLEVKELFRQLKREPSVSLRHQARMVHADGSWRWMEITYTNLLHDPSVHGYVSNARDVSDTRRYQDQLAYQASHDELTGLANRALFTTRIERALATAAPGTVAVALVDLDDFKTINDRLGHGVGDALLVAVSARMRACMRPDDVVARLGGDEFGILLTDLRTGEGSHVAERIIGALGASLNAGNHDLLIQASIGLADNEADCTAEDLLRRADLAMYAAKELGKNRYVHYDSELDARAVEHAQLAAELSHALERDELHLMYQPVVDLPTGRIVGVEALVRWEHPRDGMVPPLHFIPVAERTGLIVPMGTWILRTACRQAAEWQERYGDAAPDRMSVNVSARQLLEPTFPQTVAAVLAETGLDPSHLTVEITETAVFGGGRAVETVAAIHALGVSIALDDFGTGHSSLGLLRTCPVDVLKVDKSFVDGVTGTVEQEAIATSIIEIAQALGLRAIAEGVETGAQAERLHTLGYRLAQGFHFAKPLRSTEIENLITLAEDDGSEPAAA
ncbi:EAL domain-containing protein [Planosporangium thailandense]|uniref:EAL domain-containing protein n=1 Tax=Planosporangium thailandense TaxID=765197 RepID=A0ABX0Y027_9ACTN|nr:EAL domain-containing protein [Planosporangium thailandense]NJC70805.1 EAL domain-containing protein [Planosporangium thailandense]